MDSSETQEQHQHIRPKVRSARHQAPTALPAAASGGDLDSLLESTRQRIQSRLVVSSATENGDIYKEAPPQKETPSNTQQQQQSARTTIMTSQPPPHPNENTEKPKSILKTPKYSSEKKPAALATSEPMVTSDTEPAPAVTADKPRAAIKDVVMEREPIAQQYPSESEALSVEGYTPKPGATTQQQQQQQEENAPLVFSSISQLMSKAGTLPSSSEGSGEPQVVEADLSFACMTSQEYDETLKYSQSMMDPEAKENVCIGRGDVFSDEDSEWSDDDSLLGGASDMSEEEAPEPRAFIKIWQVISDWATPETVALLKQWRQVEMDCDESLPPQVDQSDVGSSRRKGLKSMLGMYLSPTINDLGLAQEDRRQVEFRLDSLLRTFMYSSAMAKFDSKMWKVLTCALVETVLVDSSTADVTQVMVPAAAKDVGMLPEEYRYLTRSAVTNLEASQS